MSRLCNLSIIKEALRSRAVGWLMEKKSLRLRKPIVVFESDDWGSIRMPSLDAFNYLIKNGVPLRKPKSYDCLDTIESNDDLLFLIETLNSVKDGDGNPAVMTMNTVVGNPDFEKIEKGQYEVYCFESFFDTYKKYHNSNNVEKLWNEGISNHLLRPQYHGREHLNFQRWLLFLQSKDPLVMEAFHKRVVSLGSSYHFMEAYNPSSQSEYEGIERSIREGVDVFKKSFGYFPESFIAPCYQWDSQIEDILKRIGIVIIQGNYFQKLSELEFTITNKKWVPHYLGEINSYRQVYLTRNCRFEPSENPKYNADRCLKDISRHLRAGRPAIVSCHRQNFIGSLKPNNRDNNLKQFKSLLDNIVKIFPEVTFMPSDQLGRSILSNIYEENSFHFATS